MLSRRRVSLTAAAALVAVVLAVAPACADEAGTSLDPDSAVVEYRFTDASVPPEFHRSYTLTVREGEAAIVVDSYGDVLDEATATLDDAEWTALLDRAESVGDVGGEGGDDCSGGTARALRLTDADHPEGDPALDVSVSVCGGDGGAGADALEQVVDPVLDRFDMASLLETG